MPPIKESDLTVIIKTKEVLVKIYKTIVIVEISEGIKISYENGIKVFERLKSILGDQPWVYISNRVNSYSLDPNDYRYFNEIETLRGIGVIQYEESIKTASELEKMFIQKPFKTFNDLNSAIEWGLTKIET